MLLGHKNNDMKKINSTLMMLAMMVAALSFTACSSDDDNEDDGGYDDIVFTITIDDQKDEYSRWLIPDLLGAWVNESYYKKNFLRIGVLSMGAEFQFYYPYGIDPSTFFSVGYNAFETDATEVILHVPMSPNECTYVSGSATVTKNDGKHIVVKFSNYKFTWTNNYGTRSIMFDGTLTFVIED